MISSKVVELTPKMASEYLARNGINRPLSRALVNEYARAMSLDEWMLNGEAIIISQDGRLLDGQHRCHAVIKAKKNVPILVVNGAPDESFKTLDTGRRRTAGDVLSIAGIKYHTHVASGAKMILRIEDGGKKDYKPSNSRILDCLERHPDLNYWAAQYGNSKVCRIVTSLVVGILTLAGERHGKKTCQAFFDAVNTGMSLGADDPAYQFRERFIGKGRGAKFTQEYAQAIAIKALNAHILGKPIALLRWGMTEGMPELV